MKGVRIALEVLSFFVGVVLFALRLLSGTVTLRGSSETVLAFASLDVALPTTETRRSVCGCSRRASGGRC